MSRNVVDFISLVFIRANGESASTRCFLSCCSSSRCQFPRYRALRRRSTAPLCAAKVDPRIPRVARSAGSCGGWQKLWVTRLLLPDPLAEYPKPLEESHLMWHRAPPYGVFDGELYVDGSGLHGRCQVRRRCEFSVVQTAADGSLLGAVYGALPGPLQTVPGAESSGPSSWPCSMLAHG